MQRIMTSIAFKTTAVYIVVSGLWIMLSKRFLDSLVTDPLILRTAGLVSEWFAVVAAALVLYIFMVKNEKSMAATEVKLQINNEEITAGYEELLATEEELRQQFEILLEKEEKIRRRNECLRALHETALTIMQDLAVDDLLATVVNRMKTMSGAHFGYIYLSNESDTVMEPKIVEGFPRDKVRPCLERNEGIIGRVWATGRPLVITNYHQWEGRLHEPIYDVLRTAVGIPLKAGGKVIGVFSMNYSTNYEVDAEALQIFESFAELASIAAGNARLYDALQKSENRNRALVDALPDTIFRCDRNGILLDYKPGKDSQSQLDRLDTVGQKVVDFLAAEIGAKFLHYLNQALLTGVTQLFECAVSQQNMLKQQEVRIMASGANEVIAIVRDITERKEMEQQLQYIGLHDRLTGLYNRVYFEEELSRLTESNNVPVGIIVCDIDGLKLVNDTLGHQAGDELLIFAANLLQSCFTESEVVARVGGDEFAIILPNKDSLAIERICHHIRDKVSRCLCATNSQIPIHVSIGMGVKTQAEQSLDEVFKIADDNMYREKLHSSQSTRSAIVQTLAKALEVRDFVTDGHADRLQNLIVELALAVGVPESRLPDLRLFGRFHDIGKVGIPDQILFKAGRLTDDEYEIMKRHCEIGYRIAQASAELAPIADWILKHQEWWNGQGYPLQIKGQEIPLASRILAIVDAYDAMTNDRPYRKAMSEEAAISELVRCKGTQFDPQLVEIFKQIVCRNAPNVQH